MLEGIEDVVVATHGEHAEGLDFVNGRFFSQQVVAGVGVRATFGRERIEVNCVSPMRKWVQLRPAFMNGSSSGRARSHMSEDPRSWAKSARTRGADSERGSSRESSTQRAAVVVTVPISESAKVSASM